MTKVLRDTRNGSFHGSAINDVARYSQRFAAR
jgi:hypothetical protein